MYLCFGFRLRICQVNARVAARIRDRENFAMFMDDVDLWKDDPMIIHYKASLAIVASEDGPLTSAEASHAATIASEDGPLTSAEASHAATIASEDWPLTSAGGASHAAIVAACDASDDDDCQFEWYQAALERGALDEQTKVIVTNIREAILDGRWPIPPKCRRKRRPGWGCMKKAKLDKFEGFSDAEDC